MRMKKLLGYITLLWAALALVGCREDEPIVEPVTPIIKGQSILSGAMDITTEPHTVLILFDREVEVYDSSLVTLEPYAPLELATEDVKLKISILERLAYDTEYTLTIGEGAIVDKATSGGNLPRTIVFRTEEGPHVPSEELTMQLVSSDALPVAQELYTFLWSIYGKVTLSGAMSSVAWDLNECDWVKRHTGYYPIVASFDYQYLHLSPSLSLNYGDITPADKWWSEEGLVAIDWHWMVPTAEGSRQYTYIKDETSVTVKNMLTEGTWESELLQQDLKEVADMLLLLQEKNIPVLWRPLPETQDSRVAACGAGENYWWCGATTREYKALWRTMFDYFEQRGVRNLIWVWTSQIDDIGYYPGDEYVDMVALDLYNYATANNMALICRPLGEYFPHKMIALGEMGNLPTLGQQMNEELYWSYFVPHSDQQNNFTESYPHNAATIDWWRRCFDDERVLSRGALTALKSYQAVRALK